MRRILLFGVAVLIMACFTGCEIDSSEGVTRNLTLDVTGFYTGNLSDSKLIQQVSGAPIRSLDLRQNGDRLEAYDNNGLIFRGTIGQVNGTRATFTLEGPTTSGVQGTLSGYIDVSGDSATMNGTWFEPSLSSRVSGSATVSEPQSLSISPSSATLENNNDTQTFTASGGGGGYSWSVNNSSVGNVSGSGSSVEYTRTSAGDNTITVSSGGLTRSASISQP